MHAPNTIAKQLSLTLSAALLCAMVALPTVLSAKGPQLLCCVNENGTYHPVSAKGVAAEHCIETWTLPEGENPAQYCDLGPQAQTPEQVCAVRDAPSCFDPSPAPNEYFCYLGFDMNGQLYCFAQELAP